MTNPLSKWIWRRALVITVVVVSILTEVSIGGGNSNRDVGRENAVHISEPLISDEADKALPNNPAEMKFIYERRRGFRSSASKRSALVSRRAVNTVAEELEQRIALPFDIQVNFAECGGPDSFYDNYSHRITICYELIDAYYHLFSRALNTKTAHDEAAKGAVVSMFLHEVAHALIDGWDLPITGREEDAADQFATLLLINGIRDGDQMALDGARSFQLLADLEKGLEKDYSDPHSLDEQRFFNTICLVYGHRPEQYEYLIRRGTLPTDRAFECQEDYVRLNRSWQTILAPHLFAKLPLKGP